MGRDPGPARGRAVSGSGERDSPGGPLILTVGAGLGDRESQWDRCPMSDQLDPNVFETANAGFAQAIYEDYLRDPAQVAPEWRALFESGRIGEQPPARSNGSGGGTSGGNGAGPVEAPAPAKAVPLKGPASRLAANMNESLTVPTATTFREMSVRTL